MQKYLDKKLRRRQAKDGFLGKKFQKTKAKWEKKHQDEWSNMHDENLLQDIN